MTQPEPEHWPTERMILEGHGEYALPEDLDQLSDEILDDITKLCEVTKYAPDECIPCLAGVTLLDRHKAELVEQLEDMAPKTPRLDALMSDDEEPVFTEPEVSPEVQSLPVELKRRPPVEVLQWQVAMLTQTLDEIVDGPPIPPKDVSLAELALLVLAADKWVKITEVNASDMSANQQTVLDSTKSLVARLRP